MFAVNKLVKKYKSSTSMNSENSSPWNVAPAASASPKAVSPWAVSPFQTSNPFKSPDTSSSPAETEPEPDVVSSVVMEDLPTKTNSASAFSAAFETTKEAEDPTVSGAWRVAPVAKADETVPVSAWTSAAPDAAEQVKEETPAPVEETIAPIVEEIVAVEEVVVEKEQPEMQVQVEGTTSAWTSVSVQKVAANAWTTANVVKEAAVVEEAEDAEEPAEETSALVVEKVVGPRKEIEKEHHYASSSAWTASPVGEAASSAWTSAGLEEVVPVVAKAEAAVKGSLAPKDLVEPVVETAAVEAEVESDPVEEAHVETASPWTTASVKEEADSPRTRALVREEAAPFKIATLELEVEAPELVVEKPKLVIAAPESVVIEEDGPLTSAWNLSSAQEEAAKEAVFVEEIIKPEVAAVSIEEIAAVVEAKKVMYATSSAWNTTPVQEVSAGKVKEVVKSEKEVESIQEPAVVTELTKEAPVAAVKEVVVTAKAMVVNGKIDKKAIANAFDGVASYKVDSVTKVKKIPSVEVAAAKSSDAPEACGACGVGSCSIQ